MAGIENILRRNLSLSRDFQKIDFPLNPEVEAEKR